MRLMMGLAPSKVRGVVCIPAQSPSKLQAQPQREELAKREHVEALEKLFSSFEASPQRRFAPIMPSQTTLSASPEKKGRTTRKPRKSHHEQSRSFIQQTSSFRCATPSPDVKMRKLVLNAKPSPAGHTSNLLVSSVENSSIINEAYDSSSSYYPNPKPLGTTFYIKRTPFQRSREATFELKGTRLNVPQPRPSPLFSITRIGTGPPEYYEKPSMARCYYRANTGLGCRSRSKESERPGTAATTDGRRVQYARERKRQSRSRAECDGSFVRPLTPQEYRGSRRFYFNRRIGFSNKKLLVFNFEGVVGDFYVPNVWQQTDTISLYLRPSAISTLELLSQSCQLVLLFNCLLDQAEFALNYLCKAGVRIDAAYLVSQGAWSLKPFSYEQIYIDFEIVSQVVCRSIIVGGYVCERLDKEHLLCHEGSVAEVSRSIPFILPRSHCKSVPILILLRDAKLGPGMKVTPLNVLEPILSRLQEDYDPELSSWDRLKLEAGRSKDWAVVETDRILGRVAEKARTLARLKEWRQKVVDMAKKESASGAAEPLTDPVANVKYTELMIRNEEILSGIREYYQKTTAEIEEGTPKTYPDVDISRPVTHRIVVIREMKGNLGKYAPVAAVPRTAPRKFC